MTNPYPIPRAIRQTEVLLGNGGKVYGPFDGIRVFDPEDVAVYVMLAGQAGFSLVDAQISKVAGLPFDLFTVELGANLSSSDKFVVSSERVPERSAGVVSGTRIDATALEKELSKIATVGQEIRRDLDRVVKVDFGSGEPLTFDLGLVEGDTLVIGPNGRISKGPPIGDLSKSDLKVFASKADLKLTTLTSVIAVLEGDNGADGFEYRSGDYSAQVASDTLQGLYIPRASDPFGLAGCWVRRGGWVVEGADIRLFGAVGDGVFDNTDILYTLGARPGRYRVPLGVFRTTAPILVLPGCKFVGSGCSLTKLLDSPTSNGQRGEGSWFFFDHIYAGMVFEGIGTSDMGAPYCGSFRRQPVPQDGVPFVAIDTDFDFILINCEADISGMRSFGSTRFIQVRGAYAGRVRCDARIQGHVFKAALDLSELLDVCEVDAHFWPYFSVHESVRNYTLDNLTVLKTGRIDGLRIKYLFGIFGNRLWHISSSGDRTYPEQGGKGLNTATVSFIDADFFSGENIFIEPGADHNTIYVDQLVCYGSGNTGNSSGIIIKGNDNKISIGKAILDNQSYYGLYIEGVGNRVEMSRLTLKNLAFKSMTTAAIFVTTGNSVLIAGLPVTQSLEEGRPLFAGGGTLVAPMISSRSERSIPGNQSSVTFAHGMPRKPTVEQIEISRMSPAAGGGMVYVSPNDITDTNVTIRTESVGAAETYYSVFISLR